MGECINTKGDNDRIKIRNNSLRKIVNTFEQQLKEEGIPCVTNIVQVLYVFYE